MATLAELLRQGADRLVELPNDARRFMTNPQAFTQLVTGKNPMPRETGFAAGAMSLPAQEMSVLDPNQAPYMQGYDQGEPFGIAAMALPFAAPAAVATAKALAPKAGRMAENYMVKQGFMPSIVPQGTDNAITSVNKMAIAQKNAALPVSEGGLGLSANNTAAQRATALGFDTSAYHGRYKDYAEIDPNKTFYVSSNPQYASTYTNPSASSMGGKTAQDFVDLKPNVMPVQIKSKDILDTRTPEGKKIFEQQFLGKYGNNTPLTEKGLPDWVDAEDFAEFFKDKKLPYKGVIVDEGSIPLPDGGVQWRGAATAIFDPSLVKSKFAAFDPKQANNPNLLAGGLAVPVLDEDNRKAMLEKLFNSQ